MGKWNFFSTALLREPGENFNQAIAQDSNPDREKPDYKKALHEFKFYAKTLEKMGLDVTIAQPDASPDGMYVEDTHLVLGKKLIIELNPGHPDRANEYKTLQKYLPSYIPKVVLPKQFIIDGGDILKDGKNIYIGISSRTTQEAITKLRDLIPTEYEYQIHAVKVPQGLHLKSGMTCISRDHFIIQECFADILKQMRAKNSNIKYFVVPEEESYAANVLPINGQIIIPAGCPKTKEYLLNNDHYNYSEDQIHEVDTSQTRLADGALTCTSLLFR